MKKSFYVGGFEITVREIIASISIVAIMGLLGVLIQGKISEYQMDKNEIYNKAVKIDACALPDKGMELFKYGMDTNVGNAFVYGDLCAVDTVTYPEISGEYMYVEKIKEKYTMHTRQVAHTRTVNGKTQTYYTTETYWTWDRVGSEYKKSKELSFCGLKFNSSKFDIPGANYIDTVKESSHIRYKYYGTGTKFTGTIFASLKDKTIPDGTNFYNGYNIEQTVRRLEHSGGEIIFWIFWAMVIVGLVIAFFYFENKWLE